MTELPGLIIDVEARIDRLEKGLRKANQSQARAAQQMQRAAKDSADKLRSTYGSAADGIGASFMTMGSSVKTALAGLAAGAAVVGVTQLATSARDATRSLAELGDMAQMAGVGVEQFQAWGYAAQQVRIPMDQLADGLKELSLRGDEFAVTGSGSAAEAFERLGIGADDLATRLKDPSELMLTIADRMQRLDTAGQIRVADELFGGAGERFVQLLSRGEADLRATMDRARDLGLVIDGDLIARAAELDRRFDEIAASADNLWKRGVVGAAELALEVAGVNSSLDEYIGKAEQARGLLGEGAVQGLETGGDAAMDAHADTVQRIVGIYGDLGDRARMVTGDLDNAAIQLRALGETQTADDLARISAEMLQLTRDVADGAISADEFEARLAELSDQATAAITNLSAIDGVTFSGAIGALGGLSNALAGAITLARSLRSALPGATVSGTVSPGMLDLHDDRGTSTGNMNSTGAGIANSTDNAPRNAEAPPIRPALVDDYSAPEGGWRTGPTRPEIRPTDIDFGAPEPSSGGGGGGGAARPSEYAQEVTRLREEMAALEIEATELANVTGTNYAGALELARTKAELLSAAQESGQQITPQLRSEIDQLASAYVEAGQRAEDAADRLDKIKEAGERGAQALSDVFLSVLDGSQTAKEALLDLLKQMLRVQVQKLFLNAAEGAAGGPIAMLGQLLGFDRGGWTGPGGTRKIAGVVHGQEFVMSAKATRRIGVQNLEALHRAGKGYASGGYVGTAPKLAKGASDRPVSVQISAPITVSSGAGGSPADRADLAQQIGRELESTMKGLVDKQIMNALRPGNMLNR